MTRESMTQIDPAVIRQVLDVAAATNCHAAAKRHGINPKTVYKWMRKREQSGGQWPTVEDVETWARWRAENGESQKRSARLQRDYKKRVYLQRGRVRVDGLGTRRRLQALYALGWTGPQLAERLGISPARVGHLTTGLLDKVNRETAAKIAALYDELSMIRPEDPPVRPGRTIRIHDRQRRQAVAKGYVPPLAWDDIDDPDETPTDWRYESTDRREALRDLADMGLGITEAARRLHLSRDAVERYCARHQMSDVYRKLAAREALRANQHSRGEVA